MTTSLVGSGLGPYVPQLLSGIGLTLWLAVASGALSLVLGTLVGLARTAPVALLRGLGTAYVEFFRNVPPLVLLFFAYFGLPRAGILLEPFECGLAVLSVNSAAFMAEAIRAGIQTVARSQLEAGRALGLGYVETMRYVILPQAFTVSLPPLMNTVVALVKTTALVAAIGAPVLMYEVDRIQTQTLAIFEAYGVAALLYLAIIAPLSYGAAALERRQIWAK